MNNKIELLKAMVNKPIKVEIKDNINLVSKCYIYSVDVASCVVTGECVSEYIKPADGDNNFKTSEYNDINGLELQHNDIVDYEDVYDNIDDYEYAYNYINHSDLV